MTKIFKYLKQNYYSLGSAIITKKPIKIIKKGNDYFYNGLKLTPTYLKRKVKQGFKEFLSYDFELSDKPFNSKI
jgi:hypothetical protein